MPLSRPSKRLFYFLGDWDSIKKMENTREAMVSDGPPDSDMEWLTHRLTAFATDKKGGMAGFRARNARLSWYKRLHPPRYLTTGLNRKDTRVMARKGGSFSLGSFDLQRANCKIASILQRSRGPRGSILLANSRATCNERIARSMH